MKIALKNITVRDLVADYSDKAEEGVRGPSLGMIVSEGGGRGREL